tara:strand:- start:33 stop:245 length:213 start_codon:yes stop_codon:yes gene_type:complete
MSFIKELEIISDKLDEAMEEIRIFYEDNDVYDQDWDWNILESDMFSDKFHKEYGTHSKPFAINFIPRKED